MLASSLVHMCSMLTRLQIHPILRAQAIKCTCAQEHILTMILTIAQYKGGVGKTTTAFHFAAYFQMQAPTLLIDSDPNRNAYEWAQRGGDSIPFRVVTQNQGIKVAGQYTHIINDTKAREDTSDLVEIVEGCDLLV